MARQGSIGPRRADLLVVGLNHFSVRIFVAIAQITAFVCPTRIERDDPQLLRSDFEYGDFVVEALHGAATSSWPHLSLRKRQSERLKASSGPSKRIPANMAPRYPTTNSARLREPEAPGTS